MHELTVVNQATNWQRLKALVLDSVSSPITRRVYNLGLDEFIAWHGPELRPGFTKATVNAWRMALEARGLGPMSINVRITAVRKLAVEVADNGLLAPELAAGITRVKGANAKGVRVGNWLSDRVWKEQASRRAARVSNKIIIALLVLVEWELISTWQAGAACGRVHASTCRNFVQAHEGPSSNDHIFDSGANSFATLLHEERDHRPRYSRPSRDALSRAEIPQAGKKNSRV